jgi:rod shape-determining protein MreC
MLNREPGSRTLPTFITLLVIGVLLMTFDVRSDGAGLTGTLRTGAQSIVAPLQKAAAFVVNPVVDLVDSLSNVATLREQNIALQERLAEAEAALIAQQDELALLELYEQLFEIEATGTAIGRTVAQVIGRPGILDQALIIDKGSEDGIAVGQPVIDTNGYVVGSVQHVTAGTAQVIPITAGPDAIAVTVDDHLGTVVPQLNSSEMRLEVQLADAPILAGARVVTSSQSVRFPAGLPVGEVILDAAPVAGLGVVTSVQPFVDLGRLRLVRVLAWPPDPVAAIAQPEPEVDTTTTTVAPDSTTTTGGDG